MRLFTLSVFFLLAAFGPLAAQEPAKLDLAPCGAPDYLDPWFVRFRQEPGVATSRSNDPLYLGMQLHLLARDNGTGRISVDRLLDATCQLQQDYAPANVYPMFRYEWNLINETSWFDHNELTTGIQMMFENNVPDALNAYFVSDPAGNCGYNLPYAGVAMAHSCSGEGDHTWTHEVGHALALPHPFRGWEGNPYNYNNPTPTYLLYDYTHFHSTPDTIVPAPLDTALVEYVDGSNCLLASDLICDTKPDYINYRWQCDPQGNSVLKQKDPAGVDFYSDGTLYMSYADDACQNRFTPEQINTLRAFLENQRAAWMVPGPPAPPITEVATLLLPADGANAPAQAGQIQWSTVPNATHYAVQVSRFGNFSARDVDIAVTDTTFLLPNLLADKTYYWRIRPFNAWQACTSWSPVQTFKTVTVSSVAEAGAANWRCFPSLLASGEPVTVQMPDADADGQVRVTVLDATGRLVWNVEVAAAPQFDLQLPSAHWAPGVYRLLLQSAAGAKSQALVLNN